MIIFEGNIKETEEEIVVPKKEDSLRLSITNKIKFGAFIITILSFLFIWTYASYLAVSTSPIDKLTDNISSIRTEYNINQHVERNDFFKINDDRFYAGYHYVDTLVLVTKVKNINGDDVYNHMVVYSEKNVEHAKSKARAFIDGKINIRIINERLKSNNL